MKTYTFPSKSTPGDVHSTTVHDDGTVVCSCKGAAHDCWHKKRVRSLPEVSWGKIGLSPLEERILFTYLANEQEGLALRRAFDLFPSISLEEAHALLNEIVARNTEETK